MFHYISIFGKVLLSSMVSNKHVDQYAALKSKKTEGNKIRKMVSILQRSVINCLLIGLKEFFYKNDNTY